MDKPTYRRVAVGYVKADHTRSDTDVEAWKAELNDKAEQEDLDLRKIYVEHDTSRKPILQEVVADIRSFDRPTNKIEVLLIPIMADLGFDPMTRQDIQDRLSAFDVEIMEVVRE